MNSKIEVKIEAVKLAINVEGVTSENIVETSEAIAKFILGDAELPDTHDGNALYKEMMAKLTPPTNPVSDESKEG
ncbi:MAG: hypothetical protein HFJ91_00675 [Muribaculaceae bacterium]|nr:hypothetical protein [Muribaculaceae bacterium]